MMTMETFSTSLPFRGGLPATRDSHRPQKLHHLRPSAHKKSDDERDMEGSTKFPLSKPLGPDSLALQPLSKEMAMGIVMKAAVGNRGWTTGSGMEGPPAATGNIESLEDSGRSIYPWAFFTTSPRRRMRVAFTCGVCGQRTTRAINPHAYKDGTVFVQCAGCDVYHKLVDNLNLFDEVKGVISLTSCKQQTKKQSPFDFLDTDDLSLF